MLDYEAQAPNYLQLSVEDTWLMGCIDTGREAIGLGSASQLLLASYC